MSRNVLLLTATITPLAGLPSLARTDPKVRLEDYRGALAFYARLLGGCFDLIVFAENSQSDISALAESVAEHQHVGDVEFLSFFGLDYPPAYGRGYGEFRLVDYAVENSKRLRADDVIWKVTGRYIVENISRIVAGRPPDADIYCHMRDYPYRLCELFCLAWNNRGYDAVIRGMYPELRNDRIPDRHTTEEVSARQRVEMVRGIRVVPRFAATPVVRGTRGWNNSEYSSKWSLKLTVRRLAQAIAPGIWI